MPSKKSNDKQIAQLAEAFLLLRSKDEFKKFIGDLCTLREINAMVRRWQAVGFIDQGLPYRDIAKKLSLSTTTVSRVAYWLRHGKGGYRLAFSRLAMRKNKSGCKC